MSRTPIGLRGFRAVALTAAALVAALAATAGLFARPANAQSTLDDCADQFPADGGGTHFPSYQPNGGVGTAFPSDAEVFAIDAGGMRRTIHILCKKITTAVGVANNVVAIAFTAERGSPDWVAYHLNEARMTPFTEHGVELTREGSEFYMDAQLVSRNVPQAIPFSYRYYTAVGTTGKSYVKGHLLPAGESLYDPAALNTAFSFANAAPQHESMNSGVWGTIENWTRNLARDGAAYPHGLYVITGVYGTSPTVSGGVGVTYSRIGPYTNSEVTVPACFYKVIYDPNHNSAWAFLVPNINTSNGVTADKYGITVADLQQRMLDAANDAGQQQNYSMLFPFAHLAAPGDLVTENSVWYGSPAGTMLPYPQKQNGNFPGC